MAAPPAGDARRPCAIPERSATAWSRNGRGGVGRRSRRARSPRRASGSGGWPTSTERADGSARWRPTARDVVRRAQRRLRADPVVLDVPRGRRRRPSRSSSSTGSTTTAGQPSPGSSSAPVRQRRRGRECSSSGADARGARRPGHRARRGRRPRGSATSTCSSSATGTWQIGRQASTVGQDARRSSLAPRRARRRLRPHCAPTAGSSAAGATGDLVARSTSASGDQMHDFRTFQDHVAPDTTSNLLFKGAVGDHSRTRLHRPHPGRDRTAAAPTPSRPTATSSSSSDAWAESVPNLEIENNDVHCSHASAVGPIDEEQRFYLESRGVPPEVGRAADRRRLLRRGARRRCRSPRRSPSGRDRVAAPRSAERELGVGVSDERVCCASTTLAPTARPGAFDVGGQRHRRRAHRRRRLRHRRPLHATPTSRCPRARSTPTTARSSAGSTAARSRS